MGVESPITAPSNLQRMQLPKLHITNIRPRDAGLIITLPATTYTLSFNCAMQVHICRHPQYSSAQTRRSQNIVKTLQKPNQRVNELNTCQSKTLTITSHKFLKECDKKKESQGENGAKGSFSILALSPSGSCVADAALPRFGHFLGPGAGKYSRSVLLWIKLAFEMPSKTRFSGPEGFGLISQEYGMPVCRKKEK